MLMRRSLCPLCPPCPSRKGEKKWTYEKFIRNTVRDRDKWYKRDKTTNSRHPISWPKSWHYTDLAPRSGGKFTGPSWPTARCGSGRMRDMAEYRTLREVATRMRRCPSTILRRHKLDDFPLYLDWTKRGLIWVTSDDLILKWEERKVQMSQGARLRQPPRRRHKPPISHITTG